MTVPEIQNNPYFTGNSGHFDKFHPHFHGKSGKTDPQTPYFYEFEDIFHVAPYFSDNWSRNTPFFNISRTTVLKYTLFKVCRTIMLKKTLIFTISDNSVRENPRTSFEKYPFMEPSCVHNNSVEWAHRAGKPCLTALVMFII